VDQEHGSPLPAYQKMGSPQFPSREQIVALRKAAALPASQDEAIKGNELNITLQPHALAIIEVAK
jgi:xylan 1,4-beta-xylosidase